MSTDRHVFSTMDTCFPASHSPMIGGSEVVRLSGFQKLVGNRIRSLRKARGMTQEGLAELAELHSSYIGGVERGERNMSLETVEKICRALDVQAYEVFHFELEDVYHDLVDKRATVEALSSVLLGRSVQEVTLILKITKEILNTIDRPR